MTKNFKDSQKKNMVTYKGTPLGYQQIHQQKPYWPGENRMAFSRDSKVPLSSKGIIQIRRRNKGFHRQTKAEIVHHH